jgi:excinuclease ABC subunit C
MTKEEFALIAPGIPTRPGVYTYYNQEGHIIYVGKAKQLRKRVSSYFVRQHEHFKTKKLVSEIAKIEFTIVDTEQDALLLENSLIKQHQPRYNMMLKDDRTYPYIVIKREAYPRIFLTRRLIRDGSEYLGPFPSVEQVRSLLELIRQTLPLRSCNLALTEKSIAAGKFKECLEYHIGNCKAPCIGLQSFEDYAWQVHQVKEILKGKLGDVIRYYKQEMQQLANEMQFEKAELVKKRLEYLAQYQSRSVIVNTRIDNVDVCSIVSMPDIAYVNYMIIVQGSIRQTYTLQVVKKLDESDAEILALALHTFRERFQSYAKEIISSIPFEVPQDITVTIPRSGDKKKLLALSQQNAMYFIQEQKRKATLLLNQEDNLTQTQRIERLQLDLRLTELPMHIECFDNSNFQGAYPVSAMVCFKNGLPSKKDYRHFHIKTVEGINDFASMEESVYRRYKRLVDEGSSLPQLIIIDGGKGQLSAAIKSLNLLGIMGKTTVVGLAKNIEEIFYPGDSESLRLPYDSESLHLIRRIRDEVHRFGIQFHRKTRSKGIIKNELEDIAGIGEKTATLLLQQFRSVKGIQAATEEQLIDAIGKSKTERLKKHFQKEK